MSEGLMPMPCVVESFAETWVVRARPVRCARRVRVGRAGEIGPVRKEIVFEPLPQPPVPAERPDEHAPAPPKPRVRQPVRTPRSS